MKVARSCKVYLLKCVFLSLIFFSVLLLIVRLTHHIHPIYEVIQEGPKYQQPEPWWTPLLSNLSQDDLELVGKLKSELVTPPRGNYNFVRGDKPFKEHVLERAVRQLNTLHVSEIWPKYASIYDGNPGLYCKDKRAGKLTKKCTVWNAYVDEVAQCDGNIIPIKHKRKKHAGRVCPFVKETFEDREKTRGFFVEIGAGDGEGRSPTICLEMEDKWRGLLIEADPRLWESLKAKKRKVSLALACVSLTNTSYVGKIGLFQPTQSKLIEHLANGLIEIAEVNCYPLYTYLLAVERTVIDFLVVNINGRELDVLQTLPWNRISIAIVAVCYGTRRERIAINYFLAEKGYHLYRKYHQDGESFLLFAKVQIIND